MRGTCIHPGPMRMESSSHPQTRPNPGSQYRAPHRAIFPPTTSTPRPVSPDQVSGGGKAQPGVADGPQEGSQLWWVALATRVVTYAQSGWWGGGLHVLAIEDCDHLGDGERGNT